MLKMLSQIIIIIIIIIIIKTEKETSTKQTNDVSREYSQ